MIKIEVTKKPKRRSAAEIAKADRINRVLDEARAELPHWHHLPPWEAEAFLEPKTLPSGPAKAPAQTKPSTNAEQMKGSCMSLKFEVKAGAGVPAGHYRAKFVDVEQTTHDEYGDGLKFVWEVVDGDQRGGLATRITSPNPTPKNAAGRMIAGITGTSLTPGCRVDLEPHVGRIYLLQVSTVANGNGTRVEAVIPELATK
jgi:hypothetical protein